MRRRLWTWARIVPVLVLAGSAGCDLTTLQLQDLAVSTLIQAFSQALVTAIAVAVGTPV